MKNVLVATAWKVAPGWCQKFDDWLDGRRTQKLLARAEKAGGVDRAVALLVDSKAEGSGESRLPDLAPAPNPESFSRARRLLSEYLGRSDRVRLIAVTGGHSAGKSSFLYSFFSLVKGFNHIVISLGQSKDGQLVHSGKGDTRVPVSSKEVVCSIEAGILRQILYRDPAHGKRASNLREAVVKEHWVRNLFMAVAVAAILSVASAVAIAGKKEVWGWIEIAHHNLGNSWAFAVLAGIGAYAVWFSHQLVRMASRIRLSKVNAVSGEFQLDHGNGNAPSPMNEYLEEILAYFESSGVDVVVFEDMDRFKQPGIFERLKEINKIINDSVKVKQTVRFVYALRDDVFEDATDRTKFFDGMVPVVPVVAAANVYPRLLKEMELAGFYDGSAKAKEHWGALLMDISLYVQDMRMLKAMVVDFHQYKDALNVANGDRSELKLMALMACKVKYPSEFARWQIGEGLLPDAAMMREAWLDERQVKIREEIDMIEDLLVEAKKEGQLRVEHYSELLTGRFVDTYGPLHLLRLNGVSLSDRAGALEKLASEGWEVTANLKLNNNAKNTSGMSLKELFESLDPGFEKRYGSLHAASSSGRRFHESRRAQLEAELERLSIKPLSSCLDSVLQNCTEQKAWLKELEAFPLVEVLLRLGFIDEDFRESLCEFVEGDLTAKDFEFMRDLSEQRPPKSEHDSKNYDRIALWMREPHTASPAAYNLGLIRHLAGGGVREQQLLDQIVEKQIEMHADGVARLVELHQELGINFCMLAENTSGLLMRVLDDGSADSEGRLAVGLTLIAYYSRNNKQYMLDGQVIEALQSLLDGFKGAMEVLKGHSDRRALIKVLEGMGVRFTAIGRAVDDQELVLTAMTHRFLRLNETTLFEVIKALEPEGEKVGTVTYSALPNNTAAFREWLHDEANANDLAPLVALEKITSVPESVIQGLLCAEGDGQLSNTNMKVLVHGAKFKMAKLPESGLMEGALKALLKEKRVEATWRNVFVLRQEEDANDTLEQPDRYLKAEIEAWLNSDSTISCLQEQGVPGDSMTNWLVPEIEEQRLPLKYAQDILPLLRAAYEADELESLEPKVISKVLGTSLVTPSCDIVDVLLKKGMFSACERLVADNLDVFCPGEEWDSELLSKTDLVKRLIRGQVVGGDRYRSLLASVEFTLDDLGGDDLDESLYVPSIEKVEISEGPPIKAGDFAAEEGFAVVSRPPVVQLGADALKQLLGDLARPVEERLAILVGQVQYLGEDVWPLIEGFGGAEEMLTMSDATGKLSGAVITSETTALAAALVEVGLMSSFANRGGSIVLHAKRARSTASEGLTEG
ncbi:YobI family P-loop NTPase [Ferrimonas marina]|nr:hypothetical protein [Ferrimonas marina]